MKLAVIVPVHNGNDTIDACLEALSASTRKADEILVVDDASSDLAARKAAAKYQCSLLSFKNHTAAGYATSRNKGAESVSEHNDILVFIRADIKVSPHTLAQIEKQFLATPHIDAVFGCCNDEPGDNNSIGHYLNLAQQYDQQTNNIYTSTFWAGCGAVRRHVFLEVGGFDRRYSVASIQDLELGVRLRQQGICIMRCPHILVTDLQSWSLSKFISWLVFDRAAPLTHLIMRKPGMLKDLNATTHHKGNWVVAVLIAMCLLAAPFWSLAPIATISLIVVFVAFERPMFSYFLSKSTIVLALKFVPLHLLSTWCTITGAVYARLQKISHAIYPLRQENSSSRTISKILPEKSTRTLRPHR